MRHPRGVRQNGVSRVGTQGSGGANTAGTRSFSAMCAAPTTSGGWTIRSAPAAATSHARFRMRCSWRRYAVAHCAWATAPRNPPTVRLPISVSSSSATVPDSSSCTTGTS